MRPGGHEERDPQPVEGLQHGGQDRAQRVRAGDVADADPGGAPAPGQFGEARGAERSAQRLPDGGRRIGQAGQEPRFDHVGAVGHLERQEGPAVGEPDFGHRRSPFCGPAAGRQTVP